MSGSIAPPSPVASITSTAATIGEPKITEIAAKLPAADRISSSWGGASLRASFTVYTGEASADRDQRRLGAEDGTEAERRERGERDPGQHRRLVAADLEAVRGHVAAVAREVLDRERDRDPGQADDHAGTTTTGRWSSRARRAGR